MLATKILHIGKSFLKTAAGHHHREATSPTDIDAEFARNATAAVKWLQHALQLTEQSHLNPDVESDVNDLVLMSQHQSLKVL